MSEQSHTARILAVNPWPGQVYQVLLETTQPLDFLPGQYLILQVAETLWLPYSLASVTGSCQLELHIQRSNEPGSSHQLLDYLQQSKCIAYRLPQGQCVLQGAPRPLVLVAAASGFAQIQSLLLGSWQAGWTTPVTLYWGARTLDGLYCLDAVQAWQQQHPQLRIVPVVEQPPAGWQGRRGTLLDALAEDYPEAVSARLVEGFCCGSPALVYAVEDLLMARGMPRGALLSDVHFYAPR